MGIRCAVIILAVALVPAGAESTAIADSDSRNVERTIPSPMPEHPGNVYIEGEDVAVPVPDDVTADATTWQPSTIPETRLLVEKLSAKTIRGPLRWAGSQSAGIESNSTIQTDTQRDGPHVPSSPAWQPRSRRTPRSASTQLSHGSPTMTLKNRNTSPISRHWRESTGSVIASE